jgi:hypothetical protein
MCAKTVTVVAQSVTVVAQSVTVVAQSLTVVAQSVTVVAQSVTVVAQSVTVVAQSVTVVAQSVTVVAQSVTVAAQWTKAPGIHCYVAGSIPAVTPRYCTNKIEKMLFGAKKKKMIAKMLRGLRIDLCNYIKMVKVCIWSAICHFMKTLQFFQEDVTNYL